MDISVLLKELKELLVNEYFNLIFKSAFVFPMLPYNKCEKCARINHRLRKRIFITKKPVSIKMLRRSFLRTNERNKALDLHYKIVMSQNANKKPIFL